MERSLEDRFFEFVSQREGAELIDQIAVGLGLENRERSDVFLENRHLILEVKALKDDPEYKVEERLATHRERPEFPVFYWPAELSEILGYLPDGEEVRANIFHALTRAVQGAFEKADDQVAATKRDFGLPDACGVLVILNESVGILAPDMITAKVSQMFLKKRDGHIRYQQIAAAWIIAESHQTATTSGPDGPVTILLEGPTAAQHASTLACIERLQSTWAAFNGLPLLPLGERKSFEGLKFRRLGDTRQDDQQSDGRIPRHELWRREYRAHPYLRELSKQDFLSHSANILAQLLPNFLKGAPKLSEAARRDLMVGWTHVLEEAEHRRLDMRELRPYLDQVLAPYRDRM